MDTVINITPVSYEQNTLMASSAVTQICFTGSTAATNDSKIKVMNFNDNNFENSNSMNLDDSLLNSSGTTSNINSSGSNAFDMFIEENEDLLGISFAGASSISCGK